MKCTSGSNSYIISNLNYSMKCMQNVQICGRHNWKEHDKRHVDIWFSITYLCPHPLSIRLVSRFLILQILILFCAAYNRLPPFMQIQLSWLAFVPPLWVFHPDRASLFSFPFSVKPCLNFFTRLCPVKIRNFERYVGERSGRDGLSKLTMCECCN